MDSVDDRRTPSELFLPLHREFDFTVDVASSEENFLLPRHYTKDDNGLDRSWESERVWCNPPYSNLYPWVRKAHEEVRSTVVMLLPANRTEQPFWQEYIEPWRDKGMRLSTRFVKGRTKFYNPENKKTGGSPFACVVCVWVPIDREPTRDEIAQFLKGSK